MRSQGDGDRMFQQPSLHHNRQPSSEKLQSSHALEDLKPRMPRFRGPLFPVTDDWRRSALREMERRELSRTELAAALHVHRSSVTVLFRMSTDKPAGPETSTLAKPVADYLGVPLPTQVSQEAEAAHVLRLFQAAKHKNPELFKYVVAQLEVLAGMDQQHNVVLETTKKKGK